jgi:acyl carrier protein
MNNIVTEIISIMESKDLNKIPLTPETNILKDLELDSLDIMDLIMDVEDKFDVMISSRDLTYIRTINDLALAIRDKVSECD